MNNKKMIDSESQIKRMTKNELKQWLTKHDQRLPANDRKKPYYVDKAVSYFKLLQKERANSKIKRERTKKKSLSTQRRHSSINTSPTPSLTRSKRKIIKIKRKTPTKQSPSYTKSLKKKRDRVRRRATADSLSLTKDIDDHNDDDNDSDDDDHNDTDSENNGDFNNYQQFQRSDNLKKRQFICSRDPEKMTIYDLQQWLDQNEIDFQRGQRKATYVKLVRKHSLPNSIKKEEYVSPIRKNINNAPLPRNIRQSPLTPPRDDEKIQCEGKKSGVLLTPALNKTGIRPIQTPEKAAMRDEIRSLLNLDDDQNDDLNPIYPIKDTTFNNNDITPGGPSNYDVEVLNDILSDVRREQQLQQQQQQQSPLKSSYNNDSDDIDSKENDCINVRNIASNSFFNSIMNKFSPYKQVTQSAMKDAANSVFKVHDTSIIRKGKRTIPSPASTQDSVEHYNNNNGNFSNDQLIPPSPIENYKHKISDYQDYQQEEEEEEEDDIPQTPAIPHYNQYQDEYNIINPRRSPPQKKHKIKSQEIGYNDIEDSPAIIPSKLINSSFKSKPSSFDESEAIKNQESKSNGMGKIFGKFTLFALFIALISCFFILFDGMIDININNIMNNFNFGQEEERLFCDKNKEIITGLSLASDFICYPCPKYASICTKGRVECMTNYILQDNKCILDGIIVKFAFDIKNQIGNILSLRRGKTECNEDLDKDYSMTQDELISNTEIIDERKKIEAFDYFKKNILPESQLISIKNGRYFSNIATKSTKCIIKQWAFNNILGLIATFIIIIIVFGIWRKQKLKQREIKEIELMTDEIYKLLQEFDQFETGQHIPVQRIKQKIKPRSNKIWDEAEKIIQTDVRIQKSMRMISGLQRKCWKISISNLTSTRFPPHSKRSMW